MSKPVNLTDMLLQRAEGPAAERAMQAKGAKAQARAPRTREALLPEMPQAAEAPARAARPAPSSFQERIKESQTRLSRKEHSFFKQPGHRAQAEAREGAEARGPRPTRDNPSRPESADRAPAADERGEKVQGEGARETRPAREAGKASGRRAAGRKDSAGDVEAAEAGAESPEGTAEAAVWTPVERPAALRDNAPAEGLNLDLTSAEAHAGEGSADADALLAKLEELGLEATPEQLRDPAFLAEMLWMIDALPMASPLFEGAAPLETPSPDAAGEAMAVFPAAASPEAPGAAVLPAGPAGIAASAAPEAPADLAAVPQPASGADWTQVPEGEREEVAALIREKLGMLADKEQFRGPGIPADRPDGASLPGRFVRAEAFGAPSAQAAVPAADLALSDPDRLRVLQGAVLPGPAREGLVLPEDPDAEAAPSRDGEAGPSLFRADSRGEGEGGEDAGESLPDLRGRNPQAASETPSHRDPAGIRDGAPSAFQAAMERVRAPEAKALAERPLPMQAAVQEQTVLAQIARKMSAFGLRGTEEIRIQLEPEHLGRVRIAIEMRDGGLTARISVENEAVRQAVDQNLAGLRESMENQGVKLQGLEVSVDQRPADLFNPDGSNAHDFFQRRGRAAGEASPEAETAETSETDTGRRLGYNTMEFIA